MKKSLLLVISLFVAFGFVLGGCGSSKSSTAGNKVTVLKGIGKIKKNAKLYHSLPSRIKKANVIMNGIDDSYPPMDFRDDNNNLTGFDIDIDKALSAKLGVTIKNVPTDWNGVIPSLQSKKFDMILSAMGITKERAKSVSFSKPYFLGGMTIIVNKADKQSSGIKSGKDLKGKAVGVELGSQAVIDYVDSIKGVKSVKKYDSATEALQDLANKRINAYVDDFEVANYYMQKVPGKYAKVILNIKEPYGIAFRKNDSQLQNAVQKAFDELKEEGVLSKISEKWFKYDIYK
ncbi:MAG: transporter substrate-binding domain-containing protein [Sporolactobacillus sp.]